MSHRSNDSGEPIAFFLTWNTYGTWLPGDARGWVKYKQGWQLPDPIRELEAKALCTEDACILDWEQRKVVEQCIADHCRIRHWKLHAVNCRTNHCHCVISAPVDPDTVREQLKAWSTRRLKELERNRRAQLGQPLTIPIREKWWAERGSDRWIWNDEGLEASIIYVLDGQDRPRPS